MMIYNQAFDLYHSIYRIILLLEKVEEDSNIEIDRLRIWDFYFLFPEETWNIRLRKDDKEIRRLRKQFIKKTENPYDNLRNRRKVFERLKTYQLAALSCIASYGIIDKEALKEDRIIVKSKSVIEDFIENIEVSIIEKKIASLLSLHFKQISLFGSDGLKNRTGLMESKYDA